MLGHKSSVRPLKKAMYEAGATAVISTELCQGYTKRWAIAWTFCTDLKLKEVTAMKEVGNYTHLAGSCCGLREPFLGKVLLFCLCIG